jgi:Threonine synthase
LMAQLGSKGSYEVSEGIKAQIAELFDAGCCDDDETRAEIKRVFEDCGYLLDTHTAVANRVLRCKREQQETEAYTVVVSTASPFKFASSVLEALGRDVPSDEITAVAMLETATGLDAPKSLKEIGKLPVLHKDVLKKEQAESWLLEKLL